MKYPFLLLLLLFFAVSCSEPASSIQKLEEQNKITSSYHLYPSTLRMLNIQDMESFNRLIKGVDKLTFATLQPDSFGYEQMLAFSNELQSKGGYDSYVEVEGGDRQYYLLGKESPDQTILIMSHEGSQYMVDVKGRLNLLELPNVIEDLSKIDSSETNGFIMLLDLVNQDSEREARRRKRRKEYEERKEKEQAALEHKRDSIAPDSMKLIMEPVLD